MENQKANILVIEDDALLLEAIVKKLVISELNPISYSKGEEAIEYLSGLEILPNAIWLDYHLSGMDGLTFLQKIKANPRWKSIPVVVVSNSANPDVVHHMLALGIDKYLLKADYRLDQIIETIRSLLPKEVSNEKNIGS
jgi:CheY-like chemotaxis protein